MKLPSDDKLDNPVWHSLNETHSHFSINYEKLKCYDPGYCPFGGYKGNGEIAEGINRYAKLTDHFFIVGNKPKFPTDIVLKNELVCLQMVLDRKIDIVSEEEIIKLNHQYDEALFRLVNLVQPGYFKKKTVQLGDYYGIFKNGTLVAVTGERMKMNDFTELSAIVTHPEQTGRGYAKQLITYVVNKICEEQKIPFLHVAETNTVAISLYRKLGFEIRRKISFWNLVSDL